MSLLLLIGFAVLYVGFLYAAPGPDKATTANQARPPGEPKIFRNLALGIFVFLLIDAIIFHSGFYERLLEPLSNAGRVSALAREEKHRRPAAGGREILVLGDSRMGVGFSEEVANTISAGRDVTFVNRSMQQSLPRLWYYLLREFDPSARRYQAVVMLLKPDLDPTLRHTAPVHISQTAPLLRYTDAFAFASSFDGWRDQSRAFIACLLRGSAFQPDLFDFFEHPLRRISDLRRPLSAVSLQKLDALKRRRGKNLRDVVGVEYDPATHRLKVPERLSRRQRNSLRRSIRGDDLNPSVINCSSSNCYDWTKRILQRYDSSATSIVLVHMPKGPLGNMLADTGAAAQKSAAEAFRGHKVIMFDPDEFTFLEQPAYYMDGSHLNEKGQELFTQRLTEDLLAQFDRRDPDRVQEAGDALVHEH